MGGNASKRKKYCVQDRLRTNRRPSYEESATTRAFLSDDMNFPVYQTQGDPDAYINYCESDDIAHDPVWQPRRDCGDLFAARDDDSNMIRDGKMSNCPGKCTDKEVEICMKETVLDGPDSDLYDIIPLILYSRTNSKTYSETDLKRPENENEQTNQTNKHLEFGSLEKRRQRNLHRYEEMVIIFEPLIVQNVIARHLIPHLTFLEDPDKLLAIANRSPRSAVLFIIDELKNNDKDPGRWKQFMEALERCDYSYIAGLLRGESPMDHSYQKEYLKSITPVLRDSICPIELTQALWSVDVISSEDKEEIEQVYNNFGALAATDRLLDRVPRKHRYWYSHLLDALKRLDMGHAAKMLDIPELLYFSDYEKTLPKQKNSAVRNETSQDEAMYKQDDTATSSHQQREKNGDSSEDMYQDLYEADNEVYDDCAADNISSLSTKQTNITESDEVLAGDFTCKLSSSTVSENREQDSGDVESNDEEFKDKEQSIPQTLSRSSSTCTRLSHESKTEESMSKVPDADINQLLPKMSIGKHLVPLPRVKMLTKNEASGKKEIDLDEKYSDDEYVDADDKPTSVIDSDEEIKETMTNNKMLESDEISPSRRDKRACVTITKQGATIRRPKGTHTRKSKVHSQKKKITCKRFALSRRRKQKNIFRKFDIFRQPHKNVPNVDEKVIDNGTNTEQLASNEQLSSAEQPTGTDEAKSNTWPKKLSEVTENKEYYSEPFMDEKRKTDNTRSLSTVEEDTRESNTLTKPDGSIEKCTRDKDLLELLNNCHKTYGEDGTNENTNTQESLQESITSVHPDVKPLLATVSRQQEELTVLKHQTPVLKATLENQTEINERLKRKRTLVHEISIKHKETSALKQAIENPAIQEKDEAYYTGSTSNYEDGLSSARTLIERRECRETAQHTLTTVNDEQIMNKTDLNVTYKDSAFYSYSERL